MNDRIANPAPLGFFALGVFAWVISLPFAGWFAMDQLDSDAASMALQMAGIPLGIVAILEFLRGRGFHGLFFGGFAAYAFTFAMREGPEAVPGYIGWLLLFFGLYFLFLFLAGMKEAKAAMLVFLGVAVTFLLHALGMMFGMEVLAMVAGYTGLATGLLALYTACGQIWPGKLPAT
jgi:uncharacterized protein